MKRSYALGFTTTMLLASSPVATSARPESDATILARALVSEAGQRLNADHVAVAHVLERRAQRRGETLIDTTRAYCQVYRRPASAFGRGVLAASRAELERRAPEVVALAHAWTDGERPEDPCGEGRPDHFGDRFGDRVRAERAGWVRVDCGATLNLYWRTR